METVLTALKRFIPKPLFKTLQPSYHYLLAFLGAVIYRFPSRSLRVIAVSGTKGKSTVTEIVGSIFEAAGYKTALANTIRFKIGERSRPNLYKMTMPGRFFIQKFLRQAVDANCSHAVVEVTSEAAVLSWHRFIELDALIITNIAPEHIEAHGSYEKYVDAKLSIAHSLSSSSKKRRHLIVNADDKEAGRFLATPNVEKHTYSLKNVAYTLKENGIELIWKNQKITSPLLGVFNIYNLLAAGACGEAFGIPDETIGEALGEFKSAPGRLQKIDAGQDFEVFVDYAHTIESLEAIYRTFPNKRKICILGSTGGGRDRWKRPKMGEVADNYCTEIILTNDDPYDEDPQSILEEIATGIRNKKPELIIDRREAIKKALEVATLRQAQGDKNVVVLVTGKGTDPYLMEAGGKKTPWSDAQVAREEIEKLLHARTS